jgi:flagellar operon protein
MVINKNIINNINSPVKQDDRIGHRKTTGNNKTFESFLREKMSDESAVKFSKHASIRLNMRNINLSAEQKNRIGNAVGKAEEKGIRDSLVLMDNMAFIVNIKSKTVVTAVNSNELKENVFTNIDGAVFT